jgi:uncharacterized NAD(P)/FAD-binding protein YdhS
MRLAIVGGGATAVVLLDAIDRVGLSGPLAIDVYEPRPVTGLGRPYGTDQDAALINRPADQMSIRHAHPLDFRDWVREAARQEAAGHGAAGHGAAGHEAAGHGELAMLDPEARFQPRLLFGHYLRDRLAQVTARLADRAILVTSHQSVVEDMADRDGCLTAITSSGGALTYQAVILSLGTPRPADVYQLTGRPGFVVDPYPLTEPIEPGATVTILGSNLSAVDIAVALLHRGHAGPIRLMSRNGMLPSVRANAVSADPGAARQLGDVVRLTPPARLWAAVRDVLRRQLAAGQPRLDEVALDLSAGEPPAERLRRQLDQAEDPSCWRAELLALLDPVGELLWQRLPMRTRRFFLAHVNTRVATVLNPMPPPTAATLLQAITEGRLEVVSGVTGVSPAGDDGFVVTAAGRDYRAGLILNAVRATPYGAAEPAGRLLSRLSGRALVQPHPCGGVQIDFMTNRVLGTDAALFAIGHPTSGDIYYANAGSLLGISARAENIARQIQTLSQQHIRDAHAAAAPARS